MLVLVMVMTKKRYSIRYLNNKARLSIFYLTLSTFVEKLWLPSGLNNIHVCLPSRQTTSDNPYWYNILSFLTILHLLLSVTSFSRIYVATVLYSLSASFVPVIFKSSAVIWVLCFMGHIRECRDNIPGCTYSATTTLRFCDVETLEHTSLCCSSQLLIQRGFLCICLKAVGEDMHNADYILDDILIFTITWIYHTYNDLQNYKLNIPLCYKLVIQFQVLRI